MSRKWLVVGRALAALVLVGLLIGGGAMAYRTGWSQGYAAGQLAVEGEGVTAAPYPYYGFGHMGRPFGFAPFLSGGGLFFMIGLFVLSLVVIGRIFRFRAWRMACGPQGQYWAGRHWRRPRGPMPHGPMPPWCWGWGEPSDGEAKKGEAEPDAETHAAGTEG
ncbi:MAG: hypothetical protein IMY75_04050 [Chloroflexi bacterium]|nr:hypothetical protein [Chloroflexota bacterium]